MKRTLKLGTRQSTTSSLYRRRNITGLDQLHSSHDRLLWRRNNSSSSDSSPRLPLQGLRVLDLSRVLAGPFCTQILADYGADVIKVEQPGIGDETRQWRTWGEGQKWKDEYKLMSLYFAAVNRNKRSITLNLKDKKAVEILKRLAADSDVIVNNFVPGKMEEMGLSYEALKAVNPSIIYASVSGYGAAGPSMKRAGYDAIALAEAGLLHITGEPDGPPTKPGVAIADLCTGLYAHGAILAALNARNQTGIGAKIDGSLFETSLSLLINVGLASLNLDLDKGPEKRRRGSRLGLGHPTIVPYGAFKTKNNRMMFIAATNDRQWKTFCKRMGIEGLEDDKRFHTNDGRMENRKEINDTLQRRLNEKTLVEWLEVFEGSGLPYGPVNDVVEAVEHPQSAARNMILDVENFKAARDGILKTIGPAVKFEGSTFGVRRHPPILGEHTEEVLGELGYSTEELKKWKANGVV